MPNTTAADTVGMSDPGRKPATTTDDALDVFESRDDRAEPLTAPELAEDLNCSRRTALNKLHELKDAGRVSSKKVGGRSKVWWVPIPDTPTFDDGLPEEKVNVETTDPDTRPESDDAILAVVERVSEGWDDTAARIDARKAAARAVLEHAREHGTVSKQVAKEEIRPEYPVEGQNARTWYRKNARPVLNEAAEYDQSEKAYRLDIGGR